MLMLTHVFNGFQPGHKIGTNGKVTVGVKLDLCDIETKTVLKCSAQDVYNALTRPEVRTALM